MADTGRLILLHLGRVLPVGRSYLPKLWAAFGEGKHTTLRRLRAGA